MIQKCANAACNEPFLYFRSGKIYRIEWRDAMVRGSSLAGLRRVEHFWLCGRCFPRLTLAISPSGLVGVREGNPCLQEKGKSKRYLPAESGSEPVAIPGAQGHASEARVAASGKEQGIRGLRILVLDAELKTLAFVEQVLQDSGLSVITTTSEVEADSLLATGFFDIFILINRPGGEASAAKKDVFATARFHCALCFQWDSENVRQRCNEFVAATERTESCEAPFLDGMEQASTFPRFVLSAITGVSFRGDSA